MVDGPCLKRGRRFACFSTRGVGAEHNTYPYKKYVLRFTTIEHGTLCANYTATMQFRSAEGNIKTCKCKRCTLISTRSAGELSLPHHEAGHFILAIVSKKMSFEKLFGNRIAKTSRAEKSYHHWSWRAGRKQVLTELETKRPGQRLR